MEQENSEQIFANNEKSRNAEDTKFCTHCGAKILKEAEICIHCGCICEGVRIEEKSKSENLTFVLVLSAINTLLCCPPMGIISFIFVALAMGADTREEADKKIKVAKICNYIGIGLIIVIIVLFFFLAIFEKVTGIA